MCARWHSERSALMSSIQYAINIGTLAAWLAVGGASTLGWAVQVDGHLPKRVGEVKEAELFITSEEIGSARPSEVPETAATEEVVDPEEVTEVPELLPVPDVIEVPELAELAPLPDVPQLPEALPAPERPAVKPKTGAVAGLPKEKPAASGRPAAGVGGRGTGSGAGTASGAGSSATGSDRWVGLRKASPNYPISARRAGQEGRVVVQFTVDDRGFVVDASILSPSPYAALNEEALRTVRRFRAMPGVRATTSQPIIFRLN